MASKTHPFFSNFNSGELSPKIAGRLDLTRYHNGVFEMRNFFCLPQGGVRSRYGTIFVAEAKYGDSSIELRETNLIPFAFSELQNYMIEVGHEYMRFYMDGGQIMVPSGSELVTNGTFDAGITDWDDLSTGTGSIAWDTDHMEISGGASGVGWTEQGITTTIGNIYLLMFDVGAFPLKLRIGMATGLGDILNDTQYAVSTDQVVFFVARSTTTYIQFKNSNDNLAELDNVSCKLAIPYEIETVYQEADIFDLRYAQDDENLYLVHGDYHPEILTRSSHTDWTIGDIDFIDGPYEDEIDTPTITPDWAGPSVEKVTNGGFDSDTGWTKGANWTISGGTANKSASGANNLSQDTTETATEIYMVIWTLVSISGGSITMSIGGASGAARSTVGTYTEFITAVNTNNLTFTPSAAGVVCSIDNVSVKRMSVLTASGSLFQSGHVGALWRIKHSTDTWGWCKIQKWNSVTEVLAEVRGAFGATTASTGHREGFWSDVNGWPRVVCFHEGRIIYASNYEWPNTIWASKSGSANYNNFTPGILDDDPYTWTLSDVNIIRWMEKGRVLCIGALDGETTLIGPNDAPISATEPPRVKSQTTHGSAWLDAIRVGKAILFLQKAERKIREFTYIYEDDAYSAPDITALAEHLMVNGIADIAYQQEPHSIIWAIDWDGTLLGCTYDRAQDVVGWHHHHTDGIFECVKTIPYQNEDQAWVIVQRLIDGDIKRYVEYLSPDICADSCIQYIGEETSTFYGLDHLLGKTVEIVGDGAPYPPQTIGAEGSITIDPVASEVYIGLGFTPRVITNRPEVQTAAGTSQGLLKRWNRIIARVIDTSGITINGQLVPPRTTSDLMGEAPEPFTGDVDVENLEWDADGRITIEQTLPLPAEIVCITGSLTVGDI